MYFFCIFWTLTSDIVHCFKVLCHYFIEKGLNVRLVVINVGNSVVVGVMQFQYIYIPCGLKLSLFTKFPTSHLYCQRWSIVDFSSF